VHVIDIGKCLLQPTILVTLQDPPLDGPFVESSIKGRILALQGLHNHGWGPANMRSNQIYGIEKEGMVPINVLVSWLNDSVLLYSSLLLPGSPIWPRDLDDFDTGMK
jgi:hypothetical protein